MNPVVHLGKIVDAKDLQEAQDVAREILKYIDLKTTEDKYCIMRAFVKFCSDPKEIAYMRCRVGAYELNCDCLEYKLEKAREYKKAEPKKRNVSEEVRKKAAENARKMGKANRKKPLQ